MIDIRSILKAIESGELEAIKPLPWYPKNLSFHGRRLEKTRYLRDFQLSRDKARFTIRLKSWSASCPKPHCCKVL
ncbi:hypothetical protein AtNW77_Chr3g0160251 [Arabidopsis thaliana]|nr:uncharacterized protein AT3G05365 [Arabidopsis thaliana]NP_001327726.1 uncharacterized protein AT3G05365 [Arabidopsis thaliana]NP_001327727.1 uncharacterized protein AT3G05365 [Arabidopsis thaliana]ANM65780.1 hypothetical protein AT3G05365 [Arabidopsis thaliana]ANM65781.1 hypothetical protein AT3G05365 [Arabidopsis thaliana]ANM65782.1 hypothetical protein AT3G05365 [Arabidopsis thaliana]|eukprot:NP_001327725.1 hypothetical protein AT3G05365 [Arabidopsis thaliana]